MCNKLHTRIKFLKMITRPKVVGAKLFLLIIFTNSSLLALPRIANITGIVLDSETSETIPNVVINVVDTDIYTTTRKDGSFLIEDLPDSIYQLEFSHIGPISASGFSISGLTLS